MIVALAAAGLEAAVAAYGAQDRRAAVRVAAQWDASTLRDRRRCRVVRWADAVADESGRHAQTTTYKRK